MSTTVLNAWSIAYPTISNRIKAVVSTQVNPTVTVASIIDSTDGHPSRVWSFPGLERTNYQFKLLEIDDDGVPIQQLAFFDVVPNEIDGNTLVRDHEQIKVDVTDGLVAGATGFVFDGRSIAGSTLAVGMDASLSASFHINTFKGVPAADDVISIAYRMNVNPFDFIEGTISHLFLTGESLQDGIDDLVIQATAVYPTNGAWTDDDGNKGVKFRGFSSAEATTTLDIASVGLSIKDYRGWDISICEVGGSNFLVRGTEYNWNAATGAFSFVEAGRVFAPNQDYHILFDTNPAPSGGTPTTNDFKITVLTDNATLDDSTNGKYILEPAGVSFTIKLPSVVSFPDGRVIKFEMSKSDEAKCVKIIAPDGTDIMFADGEIYICPNESISFYKFTRDSDNAIYEWRVAEPFGNFLCVGEIVNSELAPADVYNQVLLNGGTGNIIAHARFYNKFILKLGFAQRVSYASWATGNNRYKFSEADGSGNFMFASRPYTFEQGTGSGLAASVYSAQSVGEHRHLTMVDQVTTDSRFPYERGNIVSAIRSLIKGWSKTSGGAEGYYLDNSANEPTVSRTSKTGEGISTKTQPENVSYNKYIKI